MASTTEQGLPGDEPPTSEPLFGSVSFSVIQSKALSEQEAQKLTSLLEGNGGVHVPIEAGGGRVPVSAVTHIISATADFPDYSRATDAMISVVKPDWVSASLSRKRLAQIRPYSPDPRLFFAGVTICCADLPPGDKEAIIGGVVAMGGQYSGSLTRLVTHIVALTEQHEKCQQAIARKLRCTIVLPHWFDDCLKLGRRIDERPYKLPNPEITRVSSTDPVQLPSDSHLKGASSPQPGNLPTPKSPGALRSDLNVFRGKKIMLSNDLDLGSRLRGTIEDLISSGGGIVTGSVHKADIYICQYRDGEDYRTASRARKDVANLTWLYYLMTHNVWTSPLQRLLHYPVARGGLPGFRNYRISLSNYGGEARLYLENLIAAAGGEYTKTLRQDNTHLITARPHSEKCQAAREWNIHMVNHLWLEESYARWEEQSLANPRYSHFPARTNLGEVVGQTQIDRHALESVFFPPDHEDTSDDNEHAAKAGPGNDQEASAHPEATNGTRNEAEGLPFRESPTVKAANVSRAKGEGKVPKTPMASRLAADGKANETPSTTGSRSAKERAVAKLHEMAPDIALYEKEKRRAGGVVHGGRRSNGEGLAAAATKRSHSRESESEESELEEAGAPDRKKARRSKPPPASVKLLVTSYRPWIGQPRKEDEEKRRLRDLGIVVVQDPSQCTHLAAPSMIRTQKFISALAYAPIVVSSDFVDKCLETGQMPAAEAFLLKDPSTEERLGIKLTDALRNAKANAHGLLTGIVVYCTPHVHGGVETYKAIVEANGGSCMPFRARHGGGSVMPSSKKKKVGGGGDTGPSTTTSDADADEDNDPTSYVYLLSGDTRDERKLWLRFQHMARDQGRRPRIVKTEWLLDVAMSQKLKWQRDYAVVNDDDGDASEAVG